MAFGLKNFSIMTTLRPGEPSRSGRDAEPGMTRAASRRSPTHARRPSAPVNDGASAADWPLDLYRTLKQAVIAQASYVPDAGHSRLIELFHADPDVVTTVLTTEEEGIALAAGAWLGGQRAVLLLQSSGVGNCINMLSLMATCRFPLLAIVTMRGEWAEFNPWQLPMGHATAGVLSLMGVKVVRAERASEVAESVSSAAFLAFESDQQMAVLLSQRLIGRKQWTR